MLTRTDPSPDHRHRTDPPPERERPPVVQRRVVTVLSTLAVLTIAGVAFAAWTADGSGDADVVALEAESLVLSGDEDSDAALYPGAVVDLEVHVDNPNPYPVQIDRIDLDSETGITSDTAGCGDDQLIWNGEHTFTGQTVGGNDQTTVTLEKAVTMDDAPDECQGATFTVHLLLEGIQDVE